MALEPGEGPQSALREPCHSFHARFTLGDRFRLAAGPVGTLLSEAA